MVLLGLTGCGRPAPDDLLFEEKARDLGVEFVHSSGATGEFQFPEIAGSGAALFDYDNDGDLDLYLVQGGSLLQDPDRQPSDRLFRNELDTGRLHFTDVTGQAGLDARGYGMGVAAGDVDNDGWVDLYVTNVGPNQLWHNNGDGTFSDVTDRAGVIDGSRWSSSASFADYDRDGFLDLFVATYVIWDKERNPVCRKPSGARDYCGPTSHPSTPDSLYRNLGNRFEDVSVDSRIAAAYGAGLGVVATDLNDDGWLDFYVANDQMRNALWINRHDGTFEDTALMAGAAVNRDGRAEASMGLDVGDVDNDGDMDLFMTHLRNQTNTLYTNVGSGVFVDDTATSGLGGPSTPLTGFGAALIDVDNDGWLDVIIGNGRVARQADTQSGADLTPYLEPNQLFLRRGAGFEDVSPRGGPEFVRPLISRGLAVGDIDNDGDIDVVICNSAGPLQIFLNVSDDANRWVGVRLLESSGRDSHGARAYLQTDRGTKRLRQVRADGSYLSANDPRVLFGLGDETGPVSIEVHWPDGNRERFHGIEAGRYTTLTAGSGEPR